MDIYERRFTRIIETDPISPDCKIGDKVRIGFNAVVEAGCSLGNRVFIGNGTILRNDVSIGDESVIGHLVMIESEAWIGRNTTIQSQCHITKFARIDDHVFIGPKAMLINTKHISHGRGFEPELEGPHIGFGAVIGAGSIIMPGIVIGKNAVVGAGAVVTKNIPDKQIWFGFPARYRGEVPEKEILRK